MSFSVGNKILIFPQINLIILIKSFLISNFYLLSELELIKLLEL